MATTQSLSDSSSWLIFRHLSAGYARSRIPSGPKFKIRFWSEIVLDDLLTTDRPSPSSFASEMSNDVSSVCPPVPSIPNNYLLYLYMSWASNHVWLSGPLSLILFFVGPGLWVTSFIYKYKTSTTYPLYETTQCFVIINMWCLWGQSALPTIRLYPQSDHIFNNLPLWSFYQEF